MCGWVGIIGNLVHLSPARAAAGAQTNKQIKHGGILSYFYPLTPTSTETGSFVLVGHVSGVVGSFENS